MAKKSSVQNNLRRKKMALLFLKKRKILKEKISDKSLSLQERFSAQARLSSLPRNSSRTRVQSRCILTGRVRGVYRKFGLSRIMFREMASSGLIPGIVKASW